MYTAYDQILKFIDDIIKKEDGIQIWFYNKNIIKYTSDEYSSMNSANLLKQTKSIMIAYDDVPIHELYKNNNLLENKRTLVMVFTCNTSFIHYDVNETVEILNIMKSMYDINFITISCDKNITHKFYNLFDQVIPISNTYVLNFILPHILYSSQKIHPSSHPLLHKYTPKLLSSYICSVLSYVHVVSTNKLEKMVYLLSVLYGHCVEFIKDSITKDQICEYLHFHDLFNVNIEPQPQKKCDIVCDLTEMSMSEIEYCDDHLCYVIGRTDNQYILKDCFVSKKAYMLGYNYFSKIKSVLNYNTIIHHLYINTQYQPILIPLSISNKDIDTNTLMNTYYDILNSKCHNDIYDIVVNDITISLYNIHIDISNIKNNIYNMNALDRNLTFKYIILKMYLHNKISKKYTYTLYILLLYIFTSMINKYVIDKHMIIDDVFVVNGSKIKNHISKIGELIHNNYNDVAIKKYIYGLIRNEFDNKQHILSDYYKKMFIQIINNTGIIYVYNNDIFMKLMKFIGFDNYKYMIFIMYCMYFNKIKHFYNVLDDDIYNCIESIKHFHVSYITNIYVECYMKKFVH